MSGEPLRTLVLMPRSLGPAVQALPVLEALAASGRHLVTLAPAELGPVLRCAAGVAETLALRDSEDATVSSLRRAECAEGVLLDDSLDAAWLAFSGALARRWGYRGRFRRAFLKPAVVRPRRRAGGAERFRELLGAMGVEAPRSWVPRLRLGAEAGAGAEKLLERARVPATGGPLVGLAATSDHAAAALWPWQSFAELARTLRRQHPKVRQILLAGAEELWPVVRIHEETARFYPVLGPDLDLGALAAVLSRLDLLVTVESGTMHLAASLGVPCAALFGSREPARFGPAGERHRVLQGAEPALGRLLGARRRRIAGLEVETVVTACARELFDAP